MSGRRSIARTTLLLLPLQIVSRGVEALLPLLLALWFGRNDLTDVYFFAWAIFALAGSLVFSAFQDSAVVPVLAEVKLSAPQLVPLVRGSLLAHTLVLGGALAAGIGAAAAAWLGVRYTGEARTVALWMVAPFALYLVALSVKTFLASMLNAEHRYAPLPVASALGAAVTIASIALGRGALSLVAVPCGSLAGELTAIAVLWASSRAAGVAIAPTLARPEPVRRIARLVASEVGGGAVTRVNPVVDQLMATLAGVVGGGTLLKLSGDVATVPTSLLQAALLPVLLTHLSDHFAARDLATLRSIVRRALLAVVGILAAASVLLWAVRGPLLRLVFEHGAMDRAGVERMAHLLPYHLVGLAPFGALLVFARAHVAIQNSRIMVSMGLLNAALNAGLNVAFLRVLGLEGIALSTSCTYAVVAAVFALRFEWRLAALARERGAHAAAEPS
ncbi:MAG TPA: lipid II flippase MurJ [Polyangiaceae bacterium]|jgi:putative peptidoglycan lipid II flippase